MKGCFIPTDTGRYQRLYFAGQPVQYMDCGFGDAHGRAVRRSFLVDALVNRGGFRVAKDLS